MILTRKNNKHILVRRLAFDDIDRLLYYLNHLNPDTMRRFGPHRFDKQSITDLFENSDKYIGYIALDTERSEIIAYSIIKIGYLEHDSIRLKSYGLALDAEKGCTYAPSVADQWQSRGVGNSLFNFMLSDLKTLGIKRIILWGGVQSDNLKAVNYYTKNGFKTLGQFEYNGQNYDMILELT